MPNLRRKPHGATCANLDHAYTTHTHTHTHTHTQEIMSRARRPPLGQAWACATGRRCFVALWALAGPAGWRPPVSSSRPPQALPATQPQCPHSQTSAGPRARLSHRRRRRQQDEAGRRCSCAATRCHCRPAATRHLLSVVLRLRCAPDAGPASTLDAAASHGAEAACRLAPTPAWRPHPLKAAAWPHRAAPPSPDPLP